MSHTNKQTPRQRNEFLKQFANEKENTVTKQDPTRTLDPFKPTSVKLNHKQKKNLQGLL